MSACVLDSPSVGRIPNAGTLAGDKGMGTTMGPFEGEAVPDRGRA